MKRKRIGVRKLSPVYCVEDDGVVDDSALPGSNGFTKDDIDSAVQAAVTGLESKNNELLTELRSAKGGLKAWEGLDPESVRSLLDQVENDEVLKLHAAGEHDKAYEKRMEKERSTWQSKLDASTQSLSELEGNYEKSQAQVRDLIIDQQVVSSFISEKGLDTAAPDVVLRAKSAFVIEDGVAIARDQDGNIIRGADGPIKIPEWVAGLRTSAPHLFPPSQGANANGNTGGKGGSDLDARIKEAADSGDMDTYKKLRKEQQAIAS